MRHQEIVYGPSGQVLYFDAPEGRPASTQNFQVWPADADDESTEEAAVTGVAATLTSPSTTTTGAAGVDQADRTRVALAVLTGIARRRMYLLTSPSGETEWVEVREIGADFVRVRNPLANAYPVGSLFETTRIAQAVSDVWLSDTGKITDACWPNPGYRARAQYTFGGVTYVHAFYFDVVRYPQQQLVSPLDVDGRFPGWLDRLPVDHREDQGARLIETSFDALRMDARGDERLARQVRETDVMHELVCARSMLCAVEANVLAGAVKVDQLEVAEKIYMQRYNQLVREPKVPIDTSGGGAGQPAQRLKLWTR